MTDARPPTDDDVRELLVELVSGLDDVVFAKDRDGRYRMINARGGELLGMPPGDVVGRSDRDLFPAATWEQIRRSEDEILASGEARTFEEQVRFADGAVRSMRTTKMPWRDAAGRTVGILGISRDVTEERRAAAERRQLLARERRAHHRYLQLVDGLDGIVFECDPSLAVSFVSARAEQMLGHDLRRWLEEPTFWIDEVVHPDDREDVVGTIVRETAAGEDPEVEYRARAADGAVVWLRALMRVERDPNGRARTLRGVMVDVTERREASERLAEADRQKDEFLAMLGHELRNPLAAMQSALEVLKLGAGHADVARQVLERQLAQAGRLIDDLLDVSRIARGKVRLRRERLDLRAIVAACAADVASAAAERRLSLAVEAGDGPVWVDGDRARLAQVLSNLLDNAVKFSEPGGRVRVTLAPEDGEARLVVVDEGEGIDPALLDTIFRPFRQLPHRDLADHRPGGLGLGLAVVRGLAELHGGTASARSEGEGRGAELEVRLPLADGPEPARPPADDGRAAPARRLRILVVEDNADHATTQRTLLEADGHEVRVAGDAAAALREAEGFAPEVVLCDLGLPGGRSGHDLVRDLRRLPGLASTYCVAVTGYGGDEPRRRSLESGFDDHLVKPVAWARLRRVLARRFARGDA